MKRRNLLKALMGGVVGIFTGRKVVRASGEGDAAFIHINFAEHYVYIRMQNANNTERGYQFYSISSDATDMSISLPNTNDGLKTIKVFEYTEESSWGRIKLPIEGDWSKDPPV